MGEGCSRWCGAVVHVRTAAQLLRVPPAAPAPRPRGRGRPTCRPLLGGARGPPPGSQHGAQEAGAGSTAAVGSRGSGARPQSPGRALPRGTGCLSGATGDRTGGRVPGSALTHSRLPWVLSRYTQPPTRASPTRRCAPSPQPLPETAGAQAPEWQAEPGGLSPRGAPGRPVIPALRSESPPWGGRGAGGSAALSLCAVSSEPRETTPPSHSGPEGLHRGDRRVSRLPRRLTGELQGFL